MKILLGIGIALLLAFLAYYFWYLPMKAQQNAPSGNTVNPSGTMQDATAPINTGGSSGSKLVMTDAGGGNQGADIAMVPANFASAGKPLGTGITSMVATSAITGKTFVLTPDFKNISKQ